MEEADKDWTTIRMVGGRVFLLVPAHPGSPGRLDLPMERITPEVAVLRLNYRLSQCQLQ